MHVREKQLFASLITLMAWTFGARAHAQEIELEVVADEQSSSEEVPHVAQAPAAESNEVETLRAALARLEARLEAVEAIDSVESEASSESAPVVEAEPESRSFWERTSLRLSGYLQTQLVTSQLSHDEVGPDGSALNQDRFVIRRGRLRVDGAWDFASLAFEIDASTTRGPFVGIRRAEVSFFLPNRSDEGADPYVAATVGLTSTPFGFELRQGNRERLFLERTTGSLAFQRGEPDIGVRLWGGYGILRYDLAVLNGNPLDDRPGGEPVDLTKAKDFVGRVGFASERSTRFSLEGGVSFQAGTGLHRGRPATKPQFNWIDVDEDGEFDPAFESFTTPGMAATPSQTFRRWGWNVDLQIGFRTKLGWTRLYGEATVAENLDRSMYVADPITSGEDIREFAWYGALTQELSPYAIVGFRIDSYDPNADLFEQRVGVARVRDASILTLSPIVGAQLPGRGRLVAQYDRIRDHLALDASGAPTDLANDQFVVRLQMEF